MFDKVLGELNYNESWDRKESLRIFEQDYNVELRVYAEEDEEATDIQREAYLLFKNNFDIRKVEDGIFDYYQKEVCEEYRKILKEQADELAPIINDKKELTKLITPTDLIIFYCDDCREVGILFECSWDNDAGLGVLIINEEVETIGVQAEIL